MKAYATLFRVEDIKNIEKFESTYEHFGIRPAVKEKTTKTWYGRTKTTKAKECYYIFYSDSGYGYETVDECDLEFRANSLRLIIDMDQPSGKKVVGSLPYVKINLLDGTSHSKNFDDIDEMDDWVTDVLNKSQHRFQII